MHLNDVLPLFDNSIPKLAKALGVTYQAVWKWPDGRIPERQALRLQYEILPAVRGNKALERV